MGLDGLSVANLGLHRPTSPAEMAHQAEKMAQQQAETVIKKIEESDRAHLDIKQKNEDDHSGYEGRDNEQDSKREFQEETLKDEKTNKRFRVKFNYLTDMVELLDMETGKVLETIKPEDLMGLISKTKDPSGILVDREI